MGIFSSPSKQAQQSESAVQNSDEGMIQQYEKYVAQQEAQLRGAIGQQSNPYFTASAEMNPSGYAINPNDVVDFSSRGIKTPNTPTPKPARTTPNPVVPPPGVLGYSGGYGVGNNPTPPPPGIPQPAPAASGRGWRA